MIRKAFVWPFSLLMLAQCSSPASVCPVPQLVVDGLCVDLCGELDCDDGNECTLDECEIDRDELRATCVRTDAENGVTCTAGDGAGTCMAGTCQVEAPVDCERSAECPDDENPCTAPICETSTCESINVGGDCDFMGAPGVCFEAECVDAALCNPYPCEDRGPCVADQCNPETGECSYPNASNGTVCTLDDEAAECQSGACTALAPFVTGTVPTDGASGVSLETTVSATVDLALDPASVTSDSLTLKLGSETIPGDVALDASGKTVTFTPDANLLLLGEYTATLSGVSTTNGGTLAEAVSWQFTTRDGQWDTAVRVDAGADLAFGPQVAATTDGRASVTWARLVGLTNQISGNYRTAPGTWRTEEPLTLGADGGATKPGIAADPSGESVAAWLEREASSWTVRSSRFVNPEGWQASKLVGQDPTGNNAPAVGTDAGGNYLVAWDSARNDGSFLGDIWFSGSTPAGGWSARAPIQEGTTQVTRLKMAMSSGGTAVTVWHAQSDVWASRYVPPGGWRTASTIDESDATVFELDVAINALGNAVVAWSQDGAVRYNQSTTSGGWETAAIVQDGGSDPRIAMGAQGEAIVLFRRRVADVPRIQARYYTPSAGWEPPASVDDGEGDPLRHQIAMDPRGNAIAVWEQSNGSRAAIWFNRFTPSGGWEGAQQLENGAGSANAGSPQIAIDAEGTATAVWAHEGIWSRYFR